MRLHNFLLMTLACLVSLFGSASAMAQLAPDGGFVPPQHIALKLEAETTNPAPGSNVTLALSMRPDKGWHGYWMNPGDAGFAMEAKWVLPDGITAGPLRYPVPQRLIVAGLMNHVFEGPYALLSDVKIPATAKAGDLLPIELNARWLACTEQICVPEQAHRSILLRVGTGAVEPGVRQNFDAWRAALPRPLDQMARFAITGGKLRIAIPYPAAAPVSDPWFFAADPEVVVYRDQQSARRVGDVVVIEASASTTKMSTELHGVVTLSPNVALTINAQPGIVPTGGTPVGNAEPMAMEAIGLVPFLLALGGAVLGGLILNVMPCVFPILSLKAISLSRAGGDEAEARREALAYTLGILLTCLGLGGVMLALRAAGHSVGWAFQLQDVRVIALLLLLVTAITLNLAGLFALPALDGGRQQSGVSGAFLTGVLAAFVATPCTGPFMAAAVGAALLMPWPMALAIFGGLALGLALPFLAIAYLPPLRRRLPRPGMWMEWLRRIMAVPMALTALALGWLLWRQAGVTGAATAVAAIVIVVVAAMIGGTRQRAGKSAMMLGAPISLALIIGALALPTLLPTQASHAADGNAVPFSAERLTAAQAAHKPVFLYFTADWCLTCKVNEAGAIEQASVQRAFADHDVVVMAGDWTRGDPAITRFLEAHGRSGVPLYLFYPAGASEPKELPQILTPASLVQLAGG